MIIMASFLWTKPWSSKNGGFRSCADDLFADFHYLIDYRINRFQASPWTYDERQCLSQHLSNQAIIYSF